MPHFPSDSIARLLQNDQALARNYEYVDCPGQCGGRAHATNAHTLVTRVQGNPFLNRVPQVQIRPCRSGGQLLRSALLVRTGPVSLVKVTFEVNGYLLADLVKDPAMVERALADLAKVLADARAHMLQLGRHDLADRLDDLSRQLEASGEAIDGAFGCSFGEVTGAAADACADAAGPGGMRSPDDRNAQLYQALTWSLVDLVTVRVGGRGTFVHRGGGSSRGR